MTAPQEDIHPAQRPAEPDHPMVVEGGVIPGDTRFMLECLLEEYLAQGFTAKQLEHMMCDSNYQALYAAAKTLGWEECGKILGEAAARAQLFRVHVTETASPSCPQVERLFEEAESERKEGQP